MSKNMVKQEETGCQVNELGKAIESYLYEVLPDREREEGECLDDVYDEKEKECKRIAAKIVEMVESK